LFALRTKRAWRRPPASRRIRYDFWVRCEDAWGDDECGVDRSWVVSEAARNCREPLGRISAGLGRLDAFRQAPGQITEARAIGGGAESFDTNGFRFQKHSSDFFRAVLGLGDGDLKVTGAGERRATIEIHNVTLVDRKVHAIERLISGKPEHTS
jgi:hypothetical protein